MRLLRSLLLFTAFSLVWSTSYAEENNDVKKLSKLLGNVQSFSASFIQTTLSANGREVQNQRGKIDVRRPDRFRWDVKDPLPLLIVSDGKDVYIHDIDLEQVTISELDPTQIDTPAVLLSGNHDKLGSTYNVVKEQKNKATFFRLTPLQPSSPYTSITLGFENDILTELEMHDSFGQSSIIQFIDQSVNKDVDQELFTFKVPDNIDVFRNKPQ